MKRFIRLVCLLLVFATVAAFPAYALEESNRASSYLASYRAYCTKTSSTTVRVTFQVIGAGEMDEIGASTIKVQFSTDQVNWTTAKTFTRANYSSMIDYNTGMHGAELSCSVPSGLYYRAVVTFYAEKNGGFAERTYTTGII